MSTVTKPKSRRRGLILSITLLAVVTLITTGLVILWPDRAVVATEQGKVRGTVHSGYREFLGLPFAAAPTGELRWRSPEPVVPWSGVREAQRPGSPCPQTPSAPGSPSSDDEDCLYLNVTTPDGPDDRLRPVMVWLHGGGFVEGSGSEYDPRRLAVQGDVVVVTVNYRLGALGNLGLPGLAGSGAFGLMDQQAALRWVRDSIDQFGGDPGLVTLFGQSAGGQSICAHLASPLAEGLFHRAIIQSSFCTSDIPAGVLVPGIPTASPWTDPDSLQVRGEEFARGRGCTDQPIMIECLRRLPIADLLPVLSSFANPAYGSEALPKSPAVLLEEGASRSMPVLAGTTRDENTYIQALLELAGLPPLTPDGYRQQLITAFGEPATKAIERRYPLTRYRSPGHAWASVGTDSGMTCPTLERHRFQARNSPVYGFEFADRTAPPTLPPVDFPYGAYHSADAYYLFDLRDVGYTVELDRAQRELADTMINYWSNFARTGDPNGDQLPPWPRVDPTATAPTVQSLTTGRSGPTRIDQDHHCDLWSGI